VFATAREKARQTSCASNEKQLGLAIIQYVEDYDEKFPCGTDATTLNGVGWGSQVYAYVKSTGAFVCPDDTLKPQACSYNGVNWTEYPVSYFYNLMINYTGVGAAGRALSALNSPSVTVLLAEGSCYGDITDNPENGINDGQGYGGLLMGSPGWSEAVTDGTGIYNGPGFNWDDFPTLQTGTMGGYPSSTACNGTGYPVCGPATGRHTGGSNFLLCDGHVKWLRPTLVSVGGESATAATNPQSSGYECGTGDLSSGGFAATFSPT
jgi:prepilin-type processing-associated H-X9-DG protein